MHVPHSGADEAQPSSFTSLPGGDGKGDDKGDGNGANSDQQASTSVFKPLFAPRPRDASSLPSRPESRPFVFPPPFPASRVSQDHHPTIDPAINPVTITKSASNDPYGPRLLATTLFLPYMGTDPLTSIESPLAQYWDKGLLKGIISYLQTSGLLPSSAFTVIAFREINYNYPRRIALAGLMDGNSQAGDEPYLVIRIGVRPGAMDRREAAYLALETRQHLDSILAPLLPRRETELDYNRDKVHVQVIETQPALFAEGAVHTEGQVKDGQLHR